MLSTPLRKLTEETITLSAWFWWCWRLWPFWSFSSEKQGSGRPPWRITGRLLSTIYVCIVLFAIGLAYWSISQKLEANRIGDESLLKKQAGEITSLQAELGEERIAREAEFHAAYMARQANKAFQEKIAGQIGDATTLFQQQTQKILAAVESTKRNTVDTHRKIEKQLRRQHTPTVYKLF